jgi:hypothetical protein
MSVVEVVLIALALVVALATLADRLDVPVEGEDRPAVCVALCRGDCFCQERCPRCATVYFLHTFGGANPLC